MSTVAPIIHMSRHSLSDHEIAETLRAIFLSVSKDNEGSDNINDENYIHYLQDISSESENENINNDATVPNVQH